MTQEMVYLDPLVDNADIKLEDIYRRVLPETEELRIATGYFYLSGFDLLQEDIESLLDPEELEHAPMRVLMGRQTDRNTADEIAEGQSLREQFREEVKKDISELNHAQLDRLDQLKEFIEEGYVDVRVRAPENGYFHAKGTSFRLQSDVDDSYDDETDRRDCALVVGSSNFTASGQRNNVELNLTTQDPQKIVAFEDWYDNQWANADAFSEEIVDVIETSERYEEWKEQEKQEEDSDAPGVELGQYLEPFELYKLMAYDELNGNVSTRDSPLYYFQSLGYESAKEKISRYNGCIISDSVGLGKSFIGGELLYDYRQAGDRCLLIVPANLTDQWIDLLQDDTDEDGNPYFGLDVDGTHLDVMSISKFQNLSYEEVQELDSRFDVVLLDEAHRFRNFGKWRPNPSDDNDYKGTRRHANLRQLREQTMIMLTATPINNSATDLKNLISVFTSSEELLNKASLDFDAFDSYIDRSERRKRIVAGKEEATEDEREKLTEQLQKNSEEISEILNEVMVLRTRNHVKELIESDEDFEMNFKPPTLEKEEYSLPPAYQPIYRMLPDVMDALHLPHITIKNPQAGSTLKALYKLNLLKRLESSTYAFVQSVQTLHDSERALLRFLNDFPDERDIGVLQDVQDEEAPTTIDDFVEGADAAEDLEQTLEEFGFDPGALGGDSEDSDHNELADATVAEVKRYIREDLTLLSYFLSQFVGRVANDAGAVADAEVELNAWLTDNGIVTLPDVGEDNRDPILFPHTTLEDADEETLEFFRAVFSLQEFRDPKIDRLAEVLNQRDDKTLIFTQYRATADYVHRTLVENPESPLTAGNSAVVKGGDENKQGIIRRFAPEASGYQRTLAESEVNELQYVVATDTLSEGVNLQDVHVAVNYDLPWNPMRIVQRVGRIDRIGSIEDKYVHNFYPDGDIEAAIKLLERLQAKIDDIALIVGKENNILDPNEDAVLDRAGVETEKTIGEIEIEEIESSLRNSREVNDYNELDDTSKNPLLRNAGSDESAWFKRYRLKQELNEEFELETEDFEFAADYFEETPDERDLLYTNVTDHEKAPRAGVFGLAHLWFEGDDGKPEEAPLGRIRRAFYYKPFGGEIGEHPVRYLKIEPGVGGAPITGSADAALVNREEIAEHLGERLSAIRNKQVGGAFKQGEEFSKEQETLLDYLELRVIPHMGGNLVPDGVHEEYDEVGPWAEHLHDRLNGVKLKNTDEDRILRETFRTHPEYDRYPDWPILEFLKTLDDFIEENIESNAEFQETLVGESSVNARIICWGIVNS